MAPVLAVIVLSLAQVSAAVANDELKITGQVLYKSSTVASPSRAAEVDLTEIFDNNPAYMRIVALDLDKSTGFGKELFAEADRAAKKALATVAKDIDVHVITVLGGATGGTVDIEDVTEQVIAELPVYCVDGAVFHGSKRATDNLVEMDRTQVLEAIPAYRKWLELDERDADYYFLKEEYEKAYKAALRSVVRDNSITAVIELGGVTSRLDPPEDITDQVVEALDG